MVSVLNSSTRCAAFHFHRLSLMHWWSCAQSDKNQLWTIKRVSKSKKRGLDVDVLTEVSHEEIFGDATTEEVTMNPQDLFEDFDMDLSEFEAYRD